MPLILGPMHIAFIEMIIDPVCSLVFEAESEEDDVMKRPPRPPSEGVFNRLFLWVGLIDQPIQMMFTNFAVLLGMAYVFLPLMVLPVFETAFTSLRVEARESAAMLA